MVIVKNNTTRRCQVFSTVFWHSLLSGGILMQAFYTYEFFLLLALAVHSFFFLEINDYGSSPHRRYFVTIDAELMYSDLLMVFFFIIFAAQEPPGDILVFLTGQDDIDAAVQLLTEEARTNRKNSSGTKEMAVLCRSIVVFLCSCQNGCDQQWMCIYIYACLCVCVCVCSYAYGWVF